MGKFATILTPRFIGDKEKEIIMEARECLINMPVALVGKKKLPLQWGRIISPVAEHAQLGQVVSVEWDHGPIQAVTPRSLLSTDQALQEEAALMAAAVQQSSQQSSQPRSSRPFNAPNFQSSASSHPQQGVHQNPYIQQTAWQPAPVAADDARYEVMGKPSSLQDLQLALKTASKHIDQIVKGLPDQHPQTTTYNLLADQVASLSNSVAALTAPPKTKVVSKKR